MTFYKIMRYAQILKAINTALFSLRLRGVEKVDKP